MAPNFKDTQRGKECSPGVTPVRRDGPPPVHMFQCLVMYISLDKFTMFTPGLAIFLAMILRPSHVCAYNGHACGVRAGFSNSPSAGGSTLVPGHWSAVTRLFLHHHRDGGDNMDRAI
jgi:hypothetical protein